MIDDDVLRLRKEAEEALKLKQYDVALDVYEKLAEQNKPDGLLMCGLIHEYGWDKSLLDLDKAKLFYEKLAINWNSDAGYLGCVRIMLSKHEMQNKNKALDYCKDIIRGKYKRDGYINMGHIYEDLFDPPEFVLARKAYLHAFLAGSSLGLRMHAISLMRSRNYIGGSVMHIFATIAAPFLVLCGGKGVTRNG